MKQKKKIHKLVKDNFTNWYKLYSCIELNRIVGNKARWNFDELFNPTKEYSWLIGNVKESQESEMRIMMLLLFAELYPSEYVNSEMI